MNINSPKLSNPSDLFTDTTLNSNTEFAYLKSELQHFYEKNFKFKTGDDSHSYKWMQSLAWSLQVLLNEILHTPDQDKQAELIQKTYRWYKDNTKPRENFLIASPEPRPSNLKIYIPEEAPRSFSYTRKIKPYIPKYSKRQENLASSALKSFENMRQNESLSFSKTPLKLKDFLVNISPEPTEDKAQNKKFIPGPTSDNFKLRLPQIFDFRGISHKIKYKPNSNLLVNNPVRNADIQNLSEVKSKLAAKNQTVTSTQLQNALFNTHHEAIDSYSTPLPQGGEKLLLKK